MGKCDHVAWLRLRPDHQLLLQDRQRLDRLFSDLPNIREQFPSIVAFFGNKSIDVALRELFSCNNIRRSTDRAFMNIRLDYASIDKENPFVFVDSDLRSPLNMQSRDVACHVYHTMPLQGEALLPEALVASLHARLSLVMADVVCILADDYGGLRGVTTCLKLWAMAEPFSTGRILPNILVVTTDGDTGPTF